MKRWLVLGLCVVGLAGCAGPGRSSQGAPVQVQAVVFTVEAGSSLAEPRSSLSDDEERQLVQELKLAETRGEARILARPVIHTREGEAGRVVVDDRDPAAPGVPPKWGVDFGVDLCRDGGRYVVAVLSPDEIISGQGEFRVSDGISSRFDRLHHQRRDRPDSTDTAFVLLRVWRGAQEP